MKAKPFIVPASEEPRFWSKVVRGDGCWEWHGTRLSTGYGVFTVGRKNVRAHRVAFQLTYGVLQEPDLYVCHRCDNPGCVRPDHLFLGTARENGRDASAKGRLASGPRNHMKRPEHRARASLAAKDYIAAHEGCRSGERNGRAKLGRQQVAEIKKRFAGGNLTKAALARAYGVGETTIYDILRERNWRGVAESETDNDG